MRFLPKLVRAADSCAYAKDKISKGPRCLLFLGLERPFWPYHDPGPWTTGLVFAPLSVALLANTNLKGRSEKVWIRKLLCNHKSVGSILGCNPSSTQVFWKSVQ